MDNRMLFFPFNGFPYLSPSSRKVNNIPNDLKYVYISLFNKFTITTNIII